MRIHHSAAVLFDFAHIAQELSGQFFALDYQHKLRIHIGTAQVKIIGTYGAQIVIYHQGFSMGGVAAVILVQLDACSHHILFMVLIIAGSHKIISVFHGVDDHFHIRDRVDDFRKSLIHIVIGHYIRRVDDHSFFRTFHQLGQRVKDVRLLAVDSRGA